MNKKQKIRICVAILAGTIAVGVITMWKLNVRDIADRFPEIDTKIIPKAYRIVLKNAWLGKYNDVDTSTNEKWDVLMLKEIQKLTST